MTNVLEKLKSRQTRDSTANNYLTIWRQLNKFVISLDYRHNWTWEDKTALFGAYLIDNGVQSSTLKCYFSAIKHVLKMDGYIWDEKRALLSSLVKSCHLKNNRLKERLPIQKGLLELLLFEIDRHFGDKGQPYLECMYKAIFSLAYYGMMRIGELTLGDHVVKATNIHIGRSKEKIMLPLYTLKTHGQGSRPQHIRISAIPKNKSSKYGCRFFCPVQLIMSFMSRRGAYLTDEEQLFVFADRSPVTPYHFRTTLRNMLQALGLDSNLYDVHSFRSGRTCDLAKYGYSVDQIKAMGRWRSNTVYSYLKN